MKKKLLKILATTAVVAMYDFMFIYALLKWFYIEILKKGEKYMERFENKLKARKNELETQLMPFKAKSIEAYFKMEDTNKWLKFNARTKEQEERANRFSDNLKKVFAKICVFDLTYI